jgi:outer membrane lipoprotein carrier protein
LEKVEMRSWSSVILAVALCAAPLVSAPAEAQAQNTPPNAPPQLAAQSPAATQAVVDKVQAFYDKTSTFQSDFQQEYLVKAYNQRKSSHGRVTMMKPGKMSWSYDDPAGNRIVSDGSTLRVYEAANKQMFEQGVDKSQYPAALAFLTGQGKLGDVFDFKLFPGEQMSFPGGSVLVGTPKQATPAYTTVLFYVDNATSQVRSVMIIDGQGNRNKFVFNNPKVNEPVSANEFHFTPPPGTSIVHP